MDGKRGMWVALLVLLSGTSGQTQEIDSRFKISGFTEGILFDSKLDFEPGPSYGLGVGYHITALLQLNLALSYSPAKQLIPTAISTATANFSTYAVDFGISIRSRTPVFWRVSPLLETGVGMFVINPHKFEITRFEAPTEYRGSAYFQGGFAVKLSGRLELALSYRHRLLSLVAGDAVSQNRIVAQNRSLKLALAVSF